MNFSDSQIWSTAVDNEYFAHGKNLLLTMLGDDDGSVRGRALDKVLQIRQHEDSIGRVDKNMSSSAQKFASLKSPKLISIRNRMTHR